MAEASEHPPGLQSPHVTKKIRLPSGNTCHLPLKKKIRMTDSFGPLTASARSRLRCGVTVTVMSLSILSVPTNTSIWTFPTLRTTVPNIAGSSGGTVIPPQQGVLTRLDVHLGIGYEFDSEGHLCRRDVINRLYRVDEYGKRITNRTTTCPPHLDSDTWWKIFTPKDRIQWYTDMKARGAAEAKAKEESDSSSTGVDVVALRANPAPFAVPKERRKSPVQKIKQHGIAGLFSDENEAYIFNESGSEASTSGAAPASVIEPED